MTLMVTASAIFDFYLNENLIASKRIRVSVNFGAVRWLFITIVVVLVNASGGSYVELHRFVRKCD